MIELNPIFKLDNHLVKTCNKCNNTYELSMFNKASNKKSGIRGDCKICQSKSRKSYSDRIYNPEEEYYRRIKRIYNLSKEQYLEMYNKQKGCCKICGKSESNFDRKLHIDHCHKTGKVRGLLCTHCNKILGYVDDSKDYLEELKRYLDDEAK